MVDVTDARCASSTGGDELAMPGMLWCSATQWRRYPSRSVSWTRAIELRRASAGVEPRPTGARSRTERGTARVSGILGCNRLEAVSVPARLTR